MEWFKKFRTKIERYKMATLENLILKVQSYKPEADITVIKKAYELAGKIHSSNKRRSGDSLITHLLSVANLVAEIKLDENSIVAALLHETVRQGGMTKENISELFGPEVSFYVETLTELSLNQLPFQSENLAENVKKTFLLFSKNPKVALIRLADRVDNIQTIKSLSENEQVWAARQALYLFSPIAEILGVHSFKRELEDGAFAILHPETFRAISEQLALDRKEMEEAIIKLKKRLLKELAGQKILPVKVLGRSKHVYSIWKKLLRYQKEGKVRDLLAERIYDQMALMILVNEVSECYQVLGTINKIFSVVPEEFDDYIAKPKPNGYRALHTIIKDERKRIFEIQTKTLKMHEENEFGQAAHFHYKKENERFVSSADKDKTDWVERLKDWSNVNITEIFGEKIFVFSPKRDVYELPLNATPVDFAYAVHSDLGHQADGAIINGKMVSLDHKLKSGDSVLILKKEGSGPSEGWLRFVVTHMAARHINRYLHEKKRKL